MSFKPNVVRDDNLLQHWFRRRPISRALDTVLGHQLVPVSLLRRLPTPQLLRVSDFKQPAADQTARSPIRGERERFRHLKQRSG